MSSARSPRESRPRAIRLARAFSSAYVHSPRVLNGRDLFGTLPNALLEQLVEAPLGPGPLGPGELLKLEAPLLLAD